MWQREDSLSPLQQLIEHYWQPLDFTNTFNNNQQQQHQQQQPQRHNEGNSGEQINLPNSVDVHSSKKNQVRVTPFVSPMVASLMSVRTSKMTDLKVEKSNKNWNF